MKTSYPYMILARRYNLDYSAVLCFVDFLSNGDGNNYWQRMSLRSLPNEMKFLVLQEYASEQRRQSGDLRPTGSKGADQNNADGQ